MAGLEDRLRRPRWHPNQTSEEIERAIAEFRRKSAGIRPELTQPAHPEQNGSHERMHRTRATTRPPSGNLVRQQKLIDEYVGLEEVDDGIWNLYFGSRLLGRFDEREEKLYAALLCTPALPPRRPCGGPAGRAARASEQQDFRHFHSATTTM